MKRRLTKLVVFLLLGAIVNVAVAWGCAAWIRISRDPNVPRSGDEFLRSPKVTELEWRAAVWRRPGVIRILSFRPHNYEVEGEAPGSSFYIINTLTQTPAWEVSWDDLPIPRWSRVYGKSANVADPWTLIEDARGWPIYSMRSSFFVDQNGNIVSHDWISALQLSQAINSFPSFNMSDWSEPRAIPFIPIFPGFAINTIFYAAILWLLTLGPFTARRMIRRKRGHCIKCGYDLRGHSGGGGEACPECGQELCAGART